jgi:hypothetical protein
MKRIVPTDQVVYDHDFPYDWQDWDYPQSLLQSTLYSPDDPNLTDDDHVLVMDYDGFIEFFPEWNALYREEADEDWYKDDEGAKYLPYHIGRTVSPIKEVLI